MTDLNDKSLIDLPARAAGEDARFAYSNEGGHSRKGKGLPLTGCPHACGSANARAWRMGWLRADWWINEGQWQET